jgi:hypothetical protein
MKTVANYNDPEVQDSSYNLVLAARGNFLFAGYADDMHRTSTVAVWQIGPGCSLTLLSSHGGIPYRINGIAASPDGKTVILALAPPIYLRRYGPAVDSFLVAKDGTLTERGPYAQQMNLIFTVEDVDITKDNKYAIFSIESDTTSHTAMEIYRIGDDGSLSHPTEFTAGDLGPGQSKSRISLSPDERFLYVADASVDITTLQFTENPLSLAFACITSDPQEIYLAGRPVTALPTGAGGDLYVPQVPVNGDPENDSLVLASIDPSTGCTTIAGGSPFSDGHVGIISGTMAWPPRPF